MRRRALLGTIGAGALLPHAVRAQKPALPVIGFLSLLSEAALRDQLVAFQAGLADSGYVPNRNVTIEYRWANGQTDLLPTLAAELVKLPASVIVAAGGNFSAEAAKAATTRIPIVFTAVSDPVQAGLVSSFNRPGGNVTGVSILSQELDAKRFELMNELVPGNGVIGVLINPRNPVTDIQRRTLQAAAATARRNILFVEAGTKADIPKAIALVAERGAVGLLVGADPFFTGERATIAALAIRYRLPGMFQWRQYAVEGGLASYGPDFNDAYRQSGMMTGRILRGEQPATLPVQQPTKFELVLNLRTARELGIAIPSTLLGRAEELIE